MIKIESLDAKQLEQVSEWPTWVKEPCEFDWEYSQKEEFYIIEGAAKISTGRGQEVAIKAGDFVTVEKGVSSKWKVTAPIKKNFKFYP